MKGMPARERERLAVEEESIDIGKDVVDIFTSGMYVSPITVYREYIQNAADSIDVARAMGELDRGKRGGVEIEIDHVTRSVRIRDNGTGLGPDDAVRRLLAIGGSAKRGTAARGFRGIGRLAGLAYCRKLVFRTKAAGYSVVTSVTWDCQALRQRLSDGSFEGNLKDLIRSVVSVEYQDEKVVRPRDSHFFEVHLCDVVRLRNDVLLNEALIAHYLAQVGPVPFSTGFSFAQLINERISLPAGHVPIDVTVAGEKVCRPYRDETAFSGGQHNIRIEGVEFVEFANVDGELGAIGWTARHQYARSIPNAPGIRGLRARIGDLQVGEEGIFADSFKEPRFNSWCIGEIHILDPRIVPNARRDDFVVNHHYYNLLAQIGPLTGRFTQQFRKASVSRNVEQGLRNITEEVGSRIEKEHTLDPAEFSRLKSLVIRARPKLKQILDDNDRGDLAAELDKLEERLSSRPPVLGASVVALDEAVAVVSRLVTNRAQVKRVEEELRRLCQ